MDIFNYRVSSNHCPARCGIEIHRGKGGAVAIVTELPDNPGMSVCNAFENLFLQVVEAYDLDPERLVWVEHWEAWKSSEGMPYDREGEDWHLVKFRWTGTRACGARWVPVSESFVKAAVALL